MNWYLKVVKNYAGFDGRASRREYWMFFLINLLVTIGLFVIDSMLGTVNVESGYGILSGLYTLAILVPAIAVAIRRLHDTGRSGWWVLIGLIPLIGGIVLIVLLALAGNPEKNQYGPPPVAAI